MDDRHAIELNSAQRQLLAEVLESAYRQLKQEIGRTEGFEFKRELQQRRDMLYGLIEQITGQPLAD